MCSEGAALHYDEVVADISVLVSLHHLFYTGSCTHEKMTFLGRRFLEKGRRSGSCFDVQSSMMRYRTQPIADASLRSQTQWQSTALVSQYCTMRKCRRECSRGSANNGTRHATLLGDGAGAERRRKGKCKVSEKIKDSGVGQNAVVVPGSATPWAGRMCRSAGPTTQRLRAQLVAVRIELTRSQTWLTPQQQG